MGMKLDGADVRIMFEYIDRIEHRISDMEYALASIFKKLDTLLERKKPKPRTSHQVVYSESFKAVWAIYPKVSGANKKKAYAAYCTRVLESVTTSERIKTIHSAVKQYAAFCKATDRFVLLPQTYFGPDEHFLSDWTIPKKKPTEDPDRQHHPTYDPQAEIVIAEGVNPYAEDM